jgi:hypothetical protein
MKSLVHRKLYKWIAVLSLHVFVARSLLGQAPQAGEASAGFDTDITTFSQTGCGLDIQTGVARRSIADIIVAGGVSKQPLAWVRTYS